MNKYNQTPEQEAAEIEEAIKGGKIKTAARVAKGSKSLVEFAILTAQKLAITHVAEGGFYPQQLQNWHDGQPARNTMAACSFLEGRYIEAVSLAHNSVQEIITLIDTAATLASRTAKDNAIAIEQAQADTSAALDADDRDGWDGAATRAEELEEMIKSVGSVQRRMKRKIDALEITISQWSGAIESASTDGNKEAEKGLRYQRAIVSAERTALYSQWKELGIILD